MFKHLRMSGVLLISLNVSLILLSCTENTVNPVSIVINPYSYQRADLDSARFSLSMALQNQDTIVSIGLRLQTNPYNFQQADSISTVSLRQNELATKSNLQAMLNQGNYSSLHFYIPSMSAILSGKTYWQNEKTQIDIVTKPYWQKQHSQATLFHYTAWINFCTHMMNSLELKIHMIDTTLLGLDYDKAILDNTSPETTAGIVNRKIALQTCKITYLDDLLSVIKEARNLQIPDFSGISKLIPSVTAIEHGKSFWAAAIDSTQKYEIPYWEGQLQIARKSGNELWILFCEHLIDNLNQYISLGNSSLSDLDFDLKIVTEISSETPPEIINRKKNLISLQIDFYTNLIQIMEEEMALGILG